MSESSLSKDRKEQADSDLSSKIDEKCVKLLIFAQVTKNFNISG